MAINGGTNLPDSDEGRTEVSNSLMDAMRAAKDRALLITSLGLAGLGVSQQATAEDLQIAEANITPVTMTDTSPEVAGEEQTITRETLKGFMDAGLHTMIDELSDDALSYLTPIIEAIMTMENERYRDALARGMIALFLSPNQGSFDQATARFERVGLEIDETTLMTARAYIEMQQLLLEQENGVIILALATQAERIERLRENLSFVVAEIAVLESQIGTTEDRIGTTEDRIDATNARIRVASERLERLYRLRDEIEGNIEAIQLEGERQPA